MISPCNQSSAVPYMGRVLVKCHTRSIETAVTNSLAVTKGTCFVVGNPFCQTTHVTHITT
jgi:hypothetical protein